MKQYAAIDDTVHFWFAGNDTSGSGGDGASPAADVRLAGAAADAAPVYSPTPSLLSHASYPAGAYEIAITASAANGFAVNNTYAVFCTLAIDSQNPTGFVGSFDTKPALATMTDWENGERLDLLLDAIPTTAMRGTDSAALAATALSDVMWTDAKAGALTDWINGGRLDLILDIIAADTTTDIPALIATAQADLDLLTGADGATLATAQANYAPNVVIPDAAGVAPTAGENADAVWDELLTGATHNIANSAGRRLREVGAFAIHSGTAQAGTATSITIAATANGGDGVYNRNLIVLVDNTGKGQTRTIVDYNDTTKVIVIDRDWRITPDNTTTYQIVPSDTPLVVDHGTTQGGTSTTVTLRAYASSINDTYLCNQIAIIAGTGRGQARLIGAYNGTTKVATICGDAWVTTPDTTSIYVMMPYGTTCTSCIGTHALGLINTECDTALSDYDGPTRTEATADKDAIIVEVDANETKIDALQTDSTAIKAKTDNLPSGIQKNVALNNFTVFMVLTSDHVTAATGKTITGTTSKDGAAFGAMANAVSEISSGMYKVNLTQAEMNADVITLKFSETDCDQRIVVIHTS